MVSMGLYHFFYIFSNLRCRIVTINVSFISFPLPSNNLLRAMVPQLSTILQRKSIGIYVVLIGMLSNIKDFEGHGSRLYPHLCWILSNGKNYFDYIIQNRLKTFVLTTILR